MCPKNKTAKPRNILTKYKLQPVVIETHDSINNKTYGLTLKTGELETETTSSTVQKS